MTDSAEKQPCATLEDFVGGPEDALVRAFTILTLRHFGGDKKRTAKVIGISLKTLYNRLNDYGVVVVNEAVVVERLANMRRSARALRP